MSVLTHGYGSWTLKAESERRIAAYEKTIFRRILKISYRDDITNISVMQVNTEVAGPQEPLLATVKRRKLQWFGHTTRHNAEHGQRPQKTRKTTKMYLDNIREWTGLEPQELCEAAHNRPRWRKISVEASKCAPLRSARSRDE